MKFNISLASNVKDNFTTDVTLTYEELVKRLTTFSSEIIQKPNGSGFIAGHFGKKQRLTENLVARSLITLDIDNCNSDLTNLEAVLKTDLQDQWYIAYSTSSHSFKRPKIRVVVLMDKEVSTESYRTVVLNFIEELYVLKPYIDIDSSSKPNQLMFLPARTHIDYEPWFKINEGELLNPDYYIVDYGFTNLDSYNFNLSKAKPQKTKTLNSNIDQVIMTLKNKPLDITVEKVNTTLSNYKAKDTNYATWIEVGMALSHQFKGKVEGMQLWYDWSKLDNRYTKEHIAKEIKQKWPSFTISENPIKFSTIMKKAQNNKIAIINTTKKKGLHIYKNISRNKFIHTKGEKLTPLNTLNNFEVLIKEYQISIDYDVILKRQIVTFNGVVEEDLNKAQARLESLCIQNGMSFTSVSKYMLTIEREVNTWREFVESKLWDGIDRLEALYDTIKVSKEHEDIKRIYIKTWLMQMIHLTCLNDGDNGKMGRTVLVFQSNQQGGKTSWFKALCPTTHQRYLKEAVMLDTKSDMSVLKCIQHVFIELGELGSTFKKSDSDSIKNFISDTTDMLNIKFLAHHKSFRRRTVFFGSVNDLTFLQDMTGNTRYLCLPIISCDYSHNIDMQQLYAQLYSYAKDGEGYYIDEQSLIVQTELNTTFQNTSYLEEKFYDMFDTEKESRSNRMSLSQVLESFGFLPSSIKRSHLTELATFLRGMEYEREKRSPRRFNLPPLKNHRF